MISSFYNARSGIMAQEQSLNVIANNLSNTNTTAYKSERMGFADLLYTNINLPEESEEPDPARTSNGVKISQVAVSYAQGAIEETGGELDFALTGKGYFAVQTQDGEITYTRDGSFRKLLTPDGFQLATARGDLVLSVTRGPITLDPEETGASLSLDDMNIGVFSFANEYGLLKDGNNQYTPTAQSGVGTAILAPDLRQGSLERSNVDPATEMAKIIEAQRSFQLSARMLTLSDEMEQQLNNLRS
jgi:flagellar basal-body rod protein FlgG